MFSSEGYIPLSSVLQKVPVEIDEWLKVEYQPNLDKKHWWTKPDIIEFVAMSIVADKLFVAPSKSERPFKLHTNELFHFDRATLVWARDVEMAVTDEDLLANYDEEKLENARRRLLQDNKLNRGFSRLEAMAGEEKIKFASSRFYHRFNTVSPFLDRRSYSLSKKVFRSAQKLDEFTVSFFSDYAFLFKHFNHAPLVVEESFFKEKWKRAMNENFAVAMGKTKNFNSEPNIGRPRKRDMTAERYNELFLSGHGNKTWKEVCAELSADLEVVVTVDTLKRGLGLK